MSLTQTPAPYLFGEGAGLHPGSFWCAPGAISWPAKRPELGWPRRKAKRRVRSSCAAQRGGGSPSSSDCVLLVQCSSHKLNDFKETIISSMMVSFSRPRHSSEFTRVNKRTISQLRRHVSVFFDLPFYRREVQVRALEELNALRQTPSLDVRQNLAAGQPVLYPRRSI